MSRKRQPAKPIEARSRWEYLKEWTHGTVKIQCVRHDGAPAWRVRGRTVPDPQQAMDVAEGKCPERQAEIRAKCLAVDRANRSLDRLEREALAARYA